MNCTYTESKLSDNFETAQLTFVDQQGNISTNLDKNYKNMTMSVQFSTCYVIVSHCQAMIKMINAPIVLQHFECYMNAKKKTMLI